MRRCERSPALALLLAGLSSLSSGLLLLLLPQLRPRACQPCCMRAFSTHNAPAAACTSVPASVSGGWSRPPPRDQRVSAALRRAAAPYADGSRRLVRARTHVCLLSKSGAERFENGT